MAGAPTDRQSHPSEHCLGVSPGICGAHCLSGGTCPLVPWSGRAQRQETAIDAAFAPGDRGRLVGELPVELDGYDSTWLSQTPFVIRYVGPDATADVQPTLLEDYVIETVPIANLRRIS